MSLLLCRQEQVKRPLYIESLGIRIYSSQELAYVIYNHPLLVLDGFLNEALFTFLREELNLGFLALKLERWMKSSEDPDEILIMLLQESDYYSGGEISRYRSQISEIRKKHPAEYRKLRADELFYLRQYGRAAEQYKELLELPKSQTVNDGFLSAVWNNLGSCYARMFRTEQAFEAYRQAYTRQADLRILYQMYCLTKLNAGLKLGDRFKALISEELQKQWDSSMEAARAGAEDSGQVRQIEELFNRDSIRRQEGEARLLHKWKQEYRTMA